VLHRIDFVEQRITVYRGKLPVAQFNNMQQTDITEQQLEAERLYQLVCREQTEQKGRLWLFFFTENTMVSLPLAITLSALIVEHKGCAAIYDARHSSYVVSAAGNAYYRRGDFVDASGNVSVANP
jgi:hypothetical protein